jgi:hypothetical protein
VAVAQKELITAPKCSFGYIEKAASKGAAFLFHPTATWSNAAMNFFLTIRFNVKALFCSIPLLP